VLGYHLVNLAIHLINAMLVYWLFQLIAQTPRLDGSLWHTRRRELALIAALIFVAHPVLTQAVTYIYQRLASLATLWYLLGMCLYLKGRLNFQRRKDFFASAVVIAILGVLTKEIIFTLPLMIVLAELIFFDGADVFKTPRQWFERNRAVCFLVLGLGIVVLMIPMMYRIGVSDILHRQSASHSHMDETVKFANYIPTQLRVLATYLRLLVWPVNLCFDYDFPLSYSFLEPGVLSSLALIVTLLMLAVLIRRKNPLVTFGIFWFFIAVSVESLVPIRNVIWEYRTYLPMTGFCFALVGWLASVLDRRRLFVVALVLVAVLGILTVQRNRVYRTGITLWQDAVDKNPQKSRPYSQLGSSYINHGQYEKAIAPLKQALALEPGHAMAAYNLSQVYARFGRYAQALPYALTAYGVEPDLPINTGNVGYLYFAQGDYDNAIQYYQKTLELDPNPAALQVYEEVLLKSYAVHQDPGKAFQDIEFLTHFGIFNRDVEALREFVTHQEELSESPSSSVDASTGNTDDES